MENIVGYEAEKKRIEDIADVFKNSQKYKEKGIYVPKGLVLSGPAGVGKTMFAHYLAELSQARLFSFSPAIGKHAARENAQKIKTLFEEAKMSIPSIVFVDEVNNYLPSSFFESDRTKDFMATLLKALDGDGYEGIMFIGTCIDTRDIPSPVLRSGRVDEHIVLSKPDLKTRKAMIDYYLSKIDIKHDFDTKALAYKTSGLVGADIKNLVNMTARIAISSGKGKITISDCLESIYTIRCKDIKRENHSNDQELVAIHEIGHLIVGKILLGNSCDVTIDNYDYIKGMVCPNEEDDDDDDDDKGNLVVAHDKEFYLNQIATLLGGKAAEDIYIGSSSSGCSEDIDRCLDIVEDLTESGMLGFDFINLQNTERKTDWSEKHKRRLERKTESIFKESYKAACKILKACPSLLKELVEALIDKTVLVAEDSDEIFKKYGL